MKFVSLFAGIGGFDLGFERAGMECVAQVEIDEWCQRVLTKHWPDVHKFGDIKDVGIGRKYQLPSADLICGGFPCQDIAPGSSTRNGINGERSGLWHEYFRIVCEIKPKWVVVENSSNLVSSQNGDEFREILRSLSTVGYDAEWGVLSASAMGAYHQRKRAFVLAYDNQIYGQARMGHILSQEKIFENGRGKCEGAWAQTPRDFVGMDDGVSGRAYRCRVGGLGNAVVPQVAEFIGKLIMEIENERTKQKQPATA